MSLSIAFWVTYLVAVLLGGWAYRSKAGEAWPFGILMVLVLILGWGVFGSPVRA